MRSRALLCAAVLSAGLASVASAAVVGTFDMNGRVIVSPTTITWQDPTQTFNDRFVISAGTGLYTGVTGLEQINNLSNLPGNQPAGVTISPPYTFIQFLTAPSLSPLDLTFIFTGHGGSAECGNPTTFTGQTCTAPANSPFTFENQDPNGTHTTATWVMSGITHDGLYAWSATFTSQFNIPFQTVFANLALNGSVQNAYSATVTVTSVPEPGTMVLFGLGLSAIGLLKFRKKTS